MQLKFKRLHADASAPTKAHDIDAGYDLTSTSIAEVNEEGYGYIEYGTGLAIQIPIGYVGLLFPRSSVSKTGLILANCVGVIDPGYINEVKFRYKWIYDTVKYNTGDRVGQLIVIKNEDLEFIEVDELEQFDRTGGFGSSGQ